ncbi:hypothetical protein MKX01_036528 [Papaver californicum]|nr:hypothetical protein MKX01_036528 [Papaver californicum]
MGSDKKSRKRNSPSSSSEDDKVKSDKRHKSSSSSSSHRDKKSHKHSKHSDKKVKKSEENREHTHHRHNLLPGKELSKEDYFAKNNEFSTWLKEEKRKFFSDLSSEASHDLFLDFIKVWNKGKLEERYYKGISTAPRTAHNWKIGREKVS